jgi:hypothetical protein
MATNSSDVVAVGFWRGLGKLLAIMWRRIRRALSALRLPPPYIPLAPPEKFTHHSDLDAPIVVPARGHVFHFAVHATFEWKSDGMDLATLQRCTRQWKPLAMQELHRCVAAKSRNFEPHRARALEESVNRMLADGGEWRFGAMVTCSPRVGVDLDERVLEQVRTYSEQRIRMECEHEVGVRRAELAGRLSRRWLTVLEGVRESPLASGAARLTEVRLAEVVDGLLAAQGSVADLYEKILQDESMGGFEQARAHDGLMDHLSMRTYKPRARANGYNGGTGGQPA